MKRGARVTASTFGSDQSSFAWFTPTRVGTTRTAPPAEALAVVAYLRTRAGLSSAYEPGMPTPAAVATQIAAQSTPTEVPLDDVPAEDFGAVFEECCRSCHRPGSMIRGLGEVEDPELASQQAIEFIATSRQHRNVEPAAMVLAFNTIRQEAGLTPLSADMLGGE
jgi:hypothetical protein